MKSKKVTKKQIRRMRNLAKIYPKTQVAQMINLSCPTVSRYTAGIRCPRVIRKDTTKYHFTVVCPKCNKLGALVELIRTVNGKSVGSWFRVDHKVSHYL